MEKSKELTKEPELNRLETLKENVNLIQQVMKDLMKDKEHFGKIPGCGDKPTLFKAGAEKICSVFRLAPSYDIERIDSCGEREYIITCSLTHIPTGVSWGQGVGSCSTMETKYLKAKTKADTYNTILKMAKKRALVDGVLTCTACSDIFTQDLEDNQDNGHHEKLNQNPFSSNGYQDTNDEFTVNTGKEVPKDFWKDKDLQIIGGSHFRARKADDGKWYIFTKEKE